MYHITTEQIETFLNLAQKKNYREVSEMLFITQPTVTKHIQRLEKELGVLLFKRTKQSVELTEAGAYLAGTWFPIYRQFLESITEDQQSASEELLLSVCTARFLYLLNMKGSLRVCLL